ncbi:MAG: hypothetical protein K9W44_09585 [Candidatus Lokiarchaeota archaeon]|nr:hypothetical protein [Candidatus Harpocratesius repetitus]
MIKKFANPYSMVKGRRLDVTAALFMFKDLSVDEFLKNTELHDLWNVPEGKEIFIEKITDSGETFKAKEDGFVYQFDKETNEFSTLKTTEQIIVTNWLTNARKISVVDPIDNDIIKDILGTKLPDYQTMMKKIIGTNKLNANAKYWKDSIQLFTNFNYRYINLIGHEKGFVYKKAGMNDNTLIEIKVGIDIDMSLEQILKELGFENVNGVKDSKIPLGLIKNPKIQMLFLPIKIGEQYYQIFSYPKSQTVRILVNNKVESAKTIEGENTPIYTNINWRKGMFEIRLLSFAFQKIAEDNIAGVRSFYKNRKNVRGWNFKSGLQKIRTTLKNIYKNVPDIAEQLRDLFIDFNALNKDLPGIGTELKEHFFDESLEGVIVYDDSGKSIGYLDVLLKELFDNDETRKYWRTARKKKDRTLEWNSGVINQIEYILNKIIEISQDAGGFTDNKISVNLGGAADYLTQFLQKKLGYSEYLQFIKDTRLKSVNNLKSGTQIHEWELLQAAWLSLASLFSSIEALHSTIDYLLENNIRKGEKNDEYIEKYLKEKVIDDHHYYVPPSALPDPIIIIGAKKNAFIANFIQFGMAKSEVIGSGLEVLVFGSMVGQIQNDEAHTIKFFQLGTPISDEIKDIVPTTPSPYSMIIPQFSMDMWDPVNEEYYKTNRPDINNGIERFVMDFLVFENMLNLLGAEGGAVNWRYPGIYGVGMHGADAIDTEYYTEKARKVWTAFQNGLSMINIFNNQDGINTFTKMMKSPEIGGDASKMVLIELEDCRAFFNLRNLAQFQGSGIRDSVSVLAKWVYEQYTLHSSEQDLKDSNLKKKKFFNDIKLLMKSKNGVSNAYIATWKRLEGIIKAFGVKGETITIKINEDESIEYFVPTLDENGNIQFDSRLDRWYAQIENPVSIFNSNSQLLMLKQCFAYFLKYKNEMRLYYEKYADESAMNSFDAYLDAIEGFVG